MPPAVLPRCLIDGRPGDHLPASDRGLQYGDGVFETMCVRAGRVPRWDRHMARLQRGCQRLGFAAPDASLLAEEAAALIAGCEQAVLKLVVTRGSGGRGYRPPQPAEARRIFTLHPWPQFPADWPLHGVRVRWCAHRLALNPTLAGIKHLNRLDQVLARAEWDDPAIAEGLMRALDGRVIEATAANLFVVRDQRLLTPRLEDCGIAGVMRDAVLACAARLGVQTAEADLFEADLLSADELMLTNSVIGLWPVAALDGRAYPAPGPLTRRLLEALAEEAE